MAHLFNRTDLVGSALWIRVVRVGGWNGVGNLQSCVHKMHNAGYQA